MKILFFGTPDIAAACLEAILAAGHTVVGAVCQPDRPKGRGYRLLPPPVKVTATTHGIPVYQPTTLKDGSFDSTVASLAPDLNVVVAYGRLLPASVLFEPRYGSVNVHASLLPRYRGAAPMQRALMNGETETGVTIMYMDEGLDTGDMILQERFPLSDDDDLGALTSRTASVGAALLCRAVAMIGEGCAPRTPQPETGSTYAAKITDDDGILDFTMPVHTLLRRVRALCPAPFARTSLPDGRLLKVRDAQMLYEKTDKAPGTVLAPRRGDAGIRVACADGILMLVCVRPEGKGDMNGSALLCGRMVAPGDVLGEKSPEVADQL